MSLKDRVFLITGCASGIGKHMAGVVARAGGRALMTDFDADGLARTFDALGDTQGRIRIRVLDVRSAEAWEGAVHDAVESFGRLDVLLNIAGISHSAYIHEAAVERIALHLDVNLKGVMLGTRFAAEVMVQQGAGHIVNIASLAGLCPVPGMSLYSASKFGVRGFGLAIADELKPKGVFVSTLCPDAVATPMLDHEALEPEAVLSFSGNRILTVQDIERAILVDALERKKVEVIVPRSMAPLARLVCALPSLTMPLLPLFRARGLKNQARYRDSLGR